MVATGCPFWRIFIPDPGRRARHLARDIRPPGGLDAAKVHSSQGTIVEIDRLEIRLV